MHECIFPQTAITRISQPYVDALATGAYATPGATLSAPLNPSLKAGSAMVPTSFMGDSRYRAHVLQTGYTTPTLSAYPLGMSIRPSLEFQMSFVDSVRRYN